MQGSLRGDEYLDARGISGTCEGRRFGYTDQEGSHTRDRHELPPYLAGERLDQIEVPGRRNALHKIRDHHIIDGRRDLVFARHRNIDFQINEQDLRAPAFMQMDAHPRIDTQSPYEERGAFLFIPNQLSRHAATERIAVRP